MRRLKRLNSVMCVYIADLMKRFKCIFVYIKNNKSV